MQQSQIELSFHVFFVCFALAGLLRHGKLNYIWHARCYWRVIKLKTGYSGRIIALPLAYKILIIRIYLYLDPRIRRNQSVCMYIHYIETRSPYLTDLSQPLRTLCDLIVETEHPGNLDCFATLQTGTASLRVELLLALEKPLLLSVSRDINRGGCIKLTLLKVS